jgi:AcrR family transcriptional regulator
MAEKRSRGDLRNSRLQKVAANLFLRHGYERVSLDKIVELAGGSKSTVYTQFGGKCGLFISSIETLCRESNESLAHIDYSGLDLEQSLKKLAVQVLKLISSRKSVALHRLVIAEAENCPKVGEAWYMHGPARTTTFIRQILERQTEEFHNESVSLDRLAVILHDSLTGDILNRRLAGVTKSETEEELNRAAESIVQVVLATIRSR